MKVLARKPVKAASAGKRKSSLIARIKKEVGRAAIEEIREKLRRQINKEFNKTPVLTIDGVEIKLRGKQKMVAFRELNEGKIPFIIFQMISFHGIIKLIEAGYGEHLHRLLYAYFSGKISDGELMELNKMLSIASAEKSRDKRAKAKGKTNELMKEATELQQVALPGD
jgi:hypothetical protein